MFAALERLALKTGLNTGVAGTFGRIGSLFTRARPSPVNLSKTTGFMNSAVMKSLIESGHYRSGWQTAGTSAIRAFGTPLVGAGIGGTYGFFSSDYDSFNLRAEAGIRGALVGGAIGLGIGAAGAGLSINRFIGQQRAIAAPMATGTVERTFHRAVMADKRAFLSRTHHWEKEVAVPPTTTSKTVSLERNFEKTIHGERTVNTPAFMKREGRDLTRNVVSSEIFEQPSYLTGTMEKTLHGVVPGRSISARLPSTTETLSRGYPEWGRDIIDIPATMTKAKGWQMGGVGYKERFLWDVFAKSPLGQLGANTGRAIGRGARRGVVGAGKGLAGTAKDLASWGKNVWENPSMLLPGSLMSAPNFAGSMTRVGAGAAKAVGSTAGFALKHPLATAGGIAGAYGAYSFAASPRQSSPTLQGARVNTDYDAQMIAADFMQSGSYVPTGQIGPAPVMMGGMQRSFQNSAEGLTLGLHKGRHG